MTIHDEYECKHYEIIVAEVACADLVGGGLAEELLLLMEVEDKYGYERPEERWLPIHTVETIMISVISMLADPNGDSPANVDAAVRAHCISVKHAKAGRGLWFLTLLVTS